ncbi:MAG: putative aminoacrylate hydrolase RutD [Alphaproteobacteria bacterium MarineAlpha11_Bin1]|nr:MAG: putative aminoacrylate hydrolase RutD [Alphaproteobacteria bacterium MarineAlpha11_Bin1]
MPKVDIGDAEIYYEEKGSGEPIMFVPGLGGGGTVWSNQVEAFSGEYRAIVHDHRGCGKSTYSLIDYSVDQMASDALRLMDDLGIDCAHWVGHSTGGAMGQIVAQDYPDRLASLVLSATWPGQDEYFNRAFAARKSVLSNQGTAEYAKHSILTLLPPRYITKNTDRIAEMEKYLAGAEQPVEIMESRIDAICAFDRRDSMENINVPTLVIVADDDMVTPRYLSDELAEGINHAEKVILPTGGHFVLHVLVEEYNAAVGDFIRRHPMA